MPVVEVEHNGQVYRCVGDPKKMKYVQRTDFIKSLCGGIPAEPRNLEDIICDMGYSIAALKPKVKLAKSTVDLAFTYQGLRRKGARLPKFSRWSSGMFKDDKTLAADLAAAGKSEDSSSDIVISGDIMDLLRNADTPHFGSCLKAGGMYDSVTIGIVESCPGIAIAYVDDDAGRMRGRCWVHHAERVDNGNTVAIVCQKWGGTLGAEQVVAALRAKGVEAYEGGSYGREHGDANAIAVNFIGCFKKEIHHDMYTWIEGFKVSPA